MRLVARFLRTIIAIVALLTLSSASSAQLVTAQRVSVAPLALSSTTAPRCLRVIACALMQQDEGRAGMPGWLKWGLVGAVAGALTFPLLGGLASDSQQHPGRDAVAGAVVGFVIVGGSVALWESVCGAGSRSRHAGLCGR
jgi:hypothetical protein